MGKQMDQICMLEEHCQQYRRTIIIQRKNNENQNHHVLMGMEMRGRLERCLEVAGLLKIGNSISRKRKVVEE